VHAHSLSLYLQPCTKLQCTLQIRGRYRYSHCLIYFISTLYVLCVGKGPGIWRAREQKEMSAPIGGDLPDVILELGDQTGVPGVAELYQNLKGGKGHLMDVHHRILRRREVKVS
jgi:hypothetical protein